MDDLELDHYGERYDDQRQCERVIDLPAEPQPADDVRGEGAAMLTYSEWIAEYSRRNNGVTLGRCREACSEMREFYPELREVRGHVFCQWGQRGHVWLVDESGNIVDPTASQFPEIWRYEEWKLGGSVRVGRCRECGDGIWMAVQSLDVEPPHHPDLCEGCGGSAC
jgi:hypothetical protein